MVAWLWRRQHSTCYLISGTWPETHSKNPPNRDKGTGSANDDFISGFSSVVIVTITFSRTFTSVCPSNLTEQFWSAAWKEIDGKLITQQRQEIQCQPYCARKGQKCPHDFMFPSLLRDNLTRGWMLTVPYPPEDKSRYFVQCEISNTILFRHGSDSSWRFWSCEQLLRFSCLLRPSGLRSLKMTIVAFFPPPRGIFPTTTGLSMWGCCHAIKCEQTLSAAQWSELWEQHLVVMF